MQWYGFTHANLYIANLHYMQLTRFNPLIAHYIVLGESAYS